MQGLHMSLLALQDLDEQIVKAEERLREFTPQLGTLDEPLVALEREAEDARSRLQELRMSVRRLEQAAEHKRDRLHTYEQHLERVRNAREEAAARAEMDLVRRAAEADEQEALEQMEQATRTDLKLDELEKQVAKLRAELEPRREELLAAQAEIQAEIDILQDKRQNHAIRLDPKAVRLYDRIRSGLASVAVARMTVEGACGHCFNTLPLQMQSEVKRGDGLIRCEACGVILYFE